MISFILDTILNWILIFIVLINIGFFVLFDLNIKRWVYKWLKEAIKSWS